MGLLADFFRLLWGFLYWNLRKTRYRLARGRARCPCQCPSDSGRAHDTRCEACLTWNRPSRFRLLCPALEVRTDGEDHRCSLDAAAVRPFWGRAVLAGLTLLLLVWSAATITAWSVLRSRRVEVPLLAIAFPPRWPEISLARAAAWRHEGLQALQQGRLREASFLLQLAWSLDRRHADTGLLLARLSAFAAPESSDAIFRELTQREAEWSEASAQEWLGLLLARGDYAALRDLARERLRRTPPHPEAWLHALLFATRRLRDAATVSDLLADPLGQPWQSLLEAELLFRQNRTAELLPRLTRPAPQPDSYLPYYQVQLLLTLRRPAEALDLLAAYAHLLPDRDKLAAWLDAWAQLGHTTRLRATLDEILAAAPSTTSVILVANHLIRYPNPLFTAELWRHLEARPLPASPDALQAYSALFLAAAISQDGPTLSGVKKALRQRSGARFLAIDLAESFYTSHQKGFRSSNFLPLLPLSFTTLYVLQERE